MTLAMTPEVERLLESGTLAEAEGNLREALVWFEAAVKLDNEEALPRLRLGTLCHRIRDYVRAGADVLETNTFGANRIKLGSFGLAEKLAAINVEGARIARRAAGDRAYVAGSIGPLGIRIEPWGKTGVDEARDL